MTNLRGPSRFGRTQNGEFFSPDLYFCAFLQTRGLRLLRCDKDPSDGRFVFVFTHTPQIEELKRGWFDQTAEVPAQQFSSNIKALKSLVHSGTR